MISIEKKPQRLTGKWPGISKYKEDIRFSSRRLENDPPEAQYTAVTLHPDIWVEDATLIFFGNRIRLAALEGAEEINPVFFVRERKDPPVGEDPVELVMCLQKTGSELPEPQVVMRNFTNRETNYLEDSVSYLRNTYARKAGEAKVYIASRATANKIYPLQMNENFPIGYLLSAANTIVIHPEPGMIIVPDRALAIHTDLNNPTIDTSPSPPGAPFSVNSPTERSGGVLTLG